MAHFVPRNCNARCSHCFIDFDDPATFKGDLTLHEIQRVTKTLGWQIRNVNLTGGEPFLRRDFYEIADAYLTNTAIRSMYITTHGGLTDKTLEFVNRYMAAGHHRNHTLFFSISVDDFPDAHDHNRRIKGLFKKAMETRSLLDAYRERGIFANVNLTVIPANYQRIGAIYDYLVDTVGVKSFTTTIMREEGVATIEAGLHDGLYTAYRDLNQRIRKDLLSGRIHGYEGTGLGALVDAKNMVMHEQIEKTFRTGKFISTCYAGEIFVVLEANGDLRPCEVLPDVVGNVRAANFDLGALWASDAALALRNRIVETECHCTYECAWSLNTLADTKYYAPLAANFVRLKVAHRSL